MTTDDLIKIMGVVVTLIIAWLGYQQVKSKNAGDAVYATAQSVVMLSGRVRELENEKADLSDRLEAEIKRLRDELEGERSVVVELRQIILKGEAAMRSLQAQVEDDKITRDKVVKTLSERISTLESERLELQQRIAALEDELDKRDARIKELEANQRSVGQGGMLAR